MLAGIHGNNHPSSRFPKGPGIGAKVAVLSEMSQGLGEVVALGGPES